MGWPINWPPGGVVSILIIRIFDRKKVGYQQLFLAAAAPRVRSVQSAGCSRRRELLARGRGHLGSPAVSAVFLNFFFFSFLFFSSSSFPSLPFRSSAVSKKSDSLGQKHHIRWPPPRDVTQRPWRVWLNRVEEVSSQ